MNFELSDRSKDVRERLLASWTSTSTPPKPVWAEQVRAADSPHVHPPVMEDLKTEARRRGLWNLFLPNPEYMAADVGWRCRRAPARRVAMRVAKGRRVLGGGELVSVELEENVGGGQDGWRSGAAIPI